MDILWPHLDNLVLPCSQNTVRISDLSDTEEEGFSEVLSTENMPMPNIQGCPSPTYTTKVGLTVKRFLKSVGGAIAFCASVVPVLTSVRVLQYAAAWEQSCRTDPGTGYDFGSLAFLKPEGDYNLTHLKYAPGTGCELLAALEVTHRGAVCLPLQLPFFLSTFLSPLFLCSLHAPFFGSYAL